MLLDTPQGLPESILRDVQLSEGVVLEAEDLGSNSDSTTETDWDLETFVAMLAPGQTSPQGTKQKETTRDKK